MWPVKCVENIYWAISNGKVPCPPITQIEVYHMQPKLECIAQFAANSPKAQLLHEQAAWTPSLRYMWAISFGVAFAHPTGNHRLQKDCRRVTFPVVYQTVHSSPKAISEASVAVTEWTRQGGTSRHHLVPPLLLKAGQLKAGRSGPCPFGCWLAPRMETPQRLWAPNSCVWPPSQ